MFLWVSLFDLPYLTSIFFSLWVFVVSRVVRVRPWYKSLECIEVQTEGPTKTAVPSAVESPELR